MRRPIIGINCELEANRRTLGDGKQITLNPNYARCVARAGGTPVLLPPIVAADRADLSTIEAQLAAIDALILVGGDDMDPTAYSQRPHPALIPLDRERDLYDLALAKAALKRKTPILGICGGMQLLAVATGGSLHQHLPDCEGRQFAALEPVHRDQHGATKIHRVLVAADSRFASIVDSGVLETNSRHHQAVDRLGSGLRVAATAPDGVVEAIEATTDGFVLGVQWHPEESASDATSLRIFAALVAAGERTASAAAR
jgi:putative glutamine amidotransferase